MPVTYILTCEHAGNEVPEEYEYLFKGKEEILYTHKAIDFGALRLAKHLASETRLPLYCTTVSRLLAEANRSPDSEELFSEYSKDLSEKDKKILLGKIYYPHRDKVEKKVQGEIAAGNQVVHLAVHTFTPAMDGEVREADIGILFDPDRNWEATLARKLKDYFTEQNPDRKILYNSPYAGTADGFPTYLRKKFTDEQYAGFELEVNQKFFLNGEPDVWQQVVAEVTSAFKSLMDNKISVNDAEL
ncbi:N-formylglutamate amidohydrolase [Pontibacter ruber]|uniref:N-formylglutamate amidohydrolase n=1 Tax=Pontibacter ruber TaxID=1343895 RepID=A0ABW5CZM7_9BACT|nr:N-formylglutamate amidohydrolase [Pontibacter ruber]